MSRTKIYKNIYKVTGNYKMKSYLMFHKFFHTNYKFEIHDIRHKFGEVIGMDMKKLLNYEFDADHETNLKMCTYLYLFDCFAGLCILHDFYNKFEPMFYDERFNNIKPYRLSSLNKLLKNFHWYDYRDYKDHEIPSCRYEFAFMEMAKKYIDEFDHLRDGCNSELVAKYSHVDFQHDLKNLYDLWADQINMERYHWLNSLFGSDLSIVQLFVKYRPVCISLHQFQNPYEIIEQYPQIMNEFSLPHSEKHNYNMLMDHILKHKDEYFNALNIHSLYQNILFVFVHK